jgi:Fic family protein
LINRGWVQSSGIGRSAKYAINQSQSLLIPINKEWYYSEQSGLRQFAKESFDPDVFTRFSHVMSQDEQQYLSLQSKNIQTQKQKLDPTIFKRELERFTIEFSWKSSRIEGNTYSLLETEQLIKQKQEAVGHTKEEAVMILNHKTALDYVLSDPNAFKRIDREKIIHIHTLLVKDMSISVGIRSQRVGISGTNYIPPASKEKVEKYLDQTAELINVASYPLEKSLISASMIPYIQAFADGNKRTSRMIANAILLAYDLFPISYRDVDEVAYKQALILFYEQNNLYNFKKLFIDQFLWANKKYFQI